VRAYGVKLSLLPYLVLADLHQEGMHICRVSMSKVPYANYLEHKLIGLSLLQVKYYLY
jgi:hypothetical protein